MSGYGITNATTRRFARLRRSAGRIAGPALAVLLAVTTAAVPAQAATPTVTATAGATWSTLMRRKLVLDADTAQLAAVLPSLRVAANARHVELTRTRKTQTATAKTAAIATTADQTARSRHTQARTAAATAKKAVTAAQTRRPRNNGRIATATRALTAANATVKARAAAAAETASALKAAHSAYTTATRRVTTATTAYKTATNVVGNAQLKIASLPRLDSALAAQVVAVRAQVVTQSRASFTMAQTTQVYGITVNRIVAFPFQRLIDDAAKAGIQLSGGGFRTRQQQIALRISNKCPDIWTAPASSCKVQTAIPGHSLHELGLAIDLTSRNKSISSRNSAAFKWLAANAGKHGFVNLPAEPWHWSITGN